MRAFKRWLDRSLVGQAALLLVLCIGISALFRRGGHPLSWVVNGVLYTVVALAFVIAQRRRATRAAGTDARGVARLSRMIRHREVPEEPDEREAMRGLVTDQLGRLEKGRRWLPYWIALMVLAAAVTVVAGAMSGSLVFPLCFAAAVAVYCVWVLWMRRVAMDRFRFMRAALGGRGEPSGALGA